MARAQTTEKKVRFKTLKQIVQVFNFTKGFYPRLGLYFVLALGLPIFFISLIAVLTGLYWLIILGVLAGILLGLIVISRFSTKAGYKNVEGQLGASGAVLNSINMANFTFEENPVAVNIKGQELVFRGVARAGVILVSEGSPHRVKSMLENEARKIRRILPNVPIIKIQSGDLAGQVSLRKLKKTIIRQKVNLTKNEFTQIIKRLKAIGGFKMPIPKGIDPQNMKKQNRKALRG
jgi:hypothetical protein